MNFHKFSQSITNYYKLSKFFKKIEKLKSKNLLKFTFSKKIKNLTSKNLLKITFLKKNKKI